MIQYDANLIKASLVLSDIGLWLRAQCGPEDVLFDKTGDLRAVMEVGKRLEYDPGKPQWWIERYWINVCIHVKYLRRSHALRLMYAQAMLFSAHVEVFISLYTDIAWSWWPDVAKRFVSQEHRDALMPYSAW